jgi:hypothetical protein
MVSRGLTLQTDEMGFYRQVSLAASNDQKTWSNVAVSYLYRGQDKKDANLAMEYAPVHGRYLKITVNNEDNRPVSFTGAKAQLLPVRLLVKSPSLSFPLSLNWGNAKLTTPSYDVAYVLARSDNSAIVKNMPVVEVTTFNQNAKFVAKAVPLTERIPLLMPAALATAALMVGFMLFRSFKHVE